MSSPYAKWMRDWETRLSQRDSNRVVRPLDWGLEWARRWPGVNGQFPADTGGAEQFLHKINEAIVAASDGFFAYQTPADFQLERRRVHKFSTGKDRDEQDRRFLETSDEQGEFLRFTSPARTPYPENNLANARWFPARSRKKPLRAVVVLPQWNADALSHNALCRVLNRAGIASLRLSMPYHDIRKPAELERADYAVSANIARTVDAARQAVLDVRCCLDWLEARGYVRMGIVGTSLGSCYAFLASAHEPRLAVNAFNHASTYFADVVWTGQSTRHIRQALEGEVSLDSLRKSWLAISPASYFEQYARWPKKSLIVYSKYDMTFLPEFSQQVVDGFRQRGFDHRVAVLPCGHYTCEKAPFNYLDGFHLARFLAREM